MAFVFPGHCDRPPFSRDGWTPSCPWEVAQEFFILLCLCMQLLLYLFNCLDLKSQVFSLFLLSLPHPAGGEWVTVWGLVADWGETMTRVDRTRHHASGSPRWIPADTWVVKQSDLSFSHIQTYQLESSLNHHSSSSSWKPKLRTTEKLSPFQQIFNPFNKKKQNWSPGTINS